MAEFRSAMKWEFGGELYELADDRLHNGYLVFRQADRPDAPKVCYSPGFFARNFHLAKLPEEHKVTFRRKES